jgi:sigma-B regulation protein RsbU (phosphoserine phosphatase)
VDASNDVGGDLVGCFPISSGRVALFAIDVSGHGIASALMTARIAACFSGSVPGQNIALRALPGGGHEGESPDTVAGRLNRLILDEVSTGIYLTLVYAEADLTTGQVRFVQAGHPPPVVLRRNGRIETAGAGGFPVGLIDGADYEVSTLSLGPGDRLLILSDGFTEARVGDEMLEAAGAAELFLALPGRSGPDLLDGARDLLQQRTGSPPEDDLSAVLLDFRGP